MAKSKKNGTVTTPEDQWNQEVTDKVSPGDGPDLKESSTTVLDMSEDEDWSEIIVRPDASKYRSLRSVESLINEYADRLPATVIRLQEDYGFFVRGRLANVLAKKNWTTQDVSVKILNALFPDVRIAIPDRLKEDKYVRKAIASHWLFLALSELVDEGDRPYGILEYVRDGYDGNSLMSWFKHVVREEIEYAYPATFYPTSYQALRVLVEIYLFNHVNFADKFVMSASLTHIVSGNMTAEEAYNEEPVTLDGLPKDVISVVKGINPIPANRYILYVNSNRKDFYDREKALITQWKG